MNSKSFLRIKLQRILFKVHMKTVGWKSSFTYHEGIIKTKHVILTVQTKSTAIIFLRFAGDVLEIYVQNALSLKKYFS